MFLKYMHLERYGNEEVDGIEQGTTYVFPKLDGTNAQLWVDPERNLKAGSRNRKLELDNDVAEYVDEHLINKTEAKIINEKATNKMFLDKRDIPRLLQTVFYDLINEELWNIIKKHKNPKIDFAYLQRLTITKVKETRKDIFNA